MAQRLERIARAREQPAVLEDAAAQHHHLLTRRRQRLSRRPRHGVVEAGGDAATHRRPGPDRPRPPGSWAAHRGPASRTPPSPRVRDRLELDRRLPLVGDLVAQPAQRGDGVEQPAHARRQRRGERRSGRARATCSARRRSGPGSGPSQPGREQPRDRHPPRLADGAVAAGEPHRPQVPGALEIRAGRRRAARRPTPCRRGRARCRRRSRRPRGRSRRARPGTRRGARGGAGRPTVSTPSRASA